MSSAGPIPQFEPTASNPISTANAANSLGVTPIIDRRAVSNVKHPTTGRPVDFAASAAAATSSFADIVSIQRTCAPPSANATACSLKQATACSKVSSPMGTNNSPVGPIDPATTARCPLSSACAVAAWHASSAAALFISWTRRSLLWSFSLIAFAPKLFVRIRSAPARKNSSCKHKTSSGRSTHHSSGG